MSPESIARVRQYIDHQWAHTVRHHLADDGTLIGLPYPYTVPCCQDSFQEIYYWDTFFTCVGLFSQGHADLAESNIKNLCFLAERYGFVPNGNRTYYLNRSQPPYLAAMVNLIREAGDRDGLVPQMAGTLAKELGFWNSARSTPVGLSRYSHQAGEHEMTEFYDLIRDRAHLGQHPASSALLHTAHKMAEAESGWDFTPRFEHRCEDFCPIDLNSNLYFYEYLLSHISASDEAGVEWLLRAESRRKLINDLCWDESAGAFFDYDFKNARRGSLLTAAAFHPLWTGLATPEQAKAFVNRALPHLESAFGIIPCPRIVDDPATQWEAPNLWPCLQYVAYRGLDRYGFKQEAKRIATKYVDVVTRGFEQSHNLWEKYNAEDGTLNSIGEPGFSAPTMMGWTAGVFIDASDYLESFSHSLVETDRVTVA